MRSCWNGTREATASGECDNITPGEFAGVLEEMEITSAVQLTDLSVSLDLQESLGTHPELAQKILSDFSDRSCGLKNRVLILAFVGTAVHH